MRPISFWLLFWCAPLVAVGSASAEVSERIRAAVERRQAQGARPRTLTQHLQRLVDSDTEFDPARREPRAPDPATQAAYDGALCLLDDSLRTQFCGLSNETLRREWLRRYWVLQDPTPTTPENERLVEHERRVQHAREHFAAAAPASWDDRGTFYILYGPPLTVTRIPADIDDPLGYIPERMFWHYEDGVAAPFELRSPPAGPWKFGLSGKSFSWRPHIAHDARRPSNDPDKPSFSVTDPMNSAREALAMAAARNALETRHERFVMTGAPARDLWFVFDTDVFRVGGYGDAGEPSRTTLRLEAHVQFAVKDLTFRWADSLYSARYRIEGVLLDADLREAARDAYEMDLTANRFDTTNRANLWPGQVTFAVAPGSYRLALCLVDIVSGGQGTFTADVDVPAVAASRLGLSDIELATNIVGSDGYEGSRFLKTGRLVLPNPLGLYAHGSAFMAYFEIYGLKLEGGQGSRYRISYRIVPHDAASRRGRRQRAFVTTSFVSTASTRNPVEELRIDIDSLDEASYELLIEVEDLLGSGKASARTPFSVLRL